MTLNEIGSWLKEVDGCMDVLMNQCIKKKWTTLNDHGSKSEVRYETKWVPGQQDMCQTPKIKA